LHPDQQSREIILSQTPHQDRWVAFLLSLAVPGAGQLWAGRPSCLAFFAAAALLVAAGARGRAPSAPLRWAAFAGLAAISAEHAKRGLEGRGRGRRAGRATARVVERARPGRGVDLGVVVEVARTHEEVWPIVADLPRFATIDPFHGRVIVLGPALGPGVALALEHRAFGLAVMRFGRLLSWREGRGYAFSDLPARDPSRGFFPHVFDVAAEPSGEDRTRLTVRVRGRWNSRLVPRRLGRWWLRWVCREHARLLRKALA
jgi:hypothetical protein